MYPPSKNDFLTILAARIAVWSKSYIFQLKELFFEFFRRVISTLKKIQQAIAWFFNQIRDSYYRLEGTLLGGVVRLWFFAIELKSILFLFLVAVALWYLHWVAFFIYIFVLVVAIKSSKIDSTSLIKEIESQKQSSAILVGKLRRPLRFLIPILVTFYFYLPFDKLPHIVDFLSFFGRNQVTLPALTIGGVSNSAPLPQKLDSEHKITPSTDTVRKNLVKPVPQFDEIWLKNPCDMDVGFAVHYDKGNNKWATSLFIVPSGETIKTDLQSHNRLIYIYAKSSDGKSEWDGNDDPEGKVVEVTQDGNLTPASFFSVDTGGSYGNKITPNISCN